MSDKQQNSGQGPTDPATLRKQAEKQARSMEPISLSTQTPEEIQRILHELRVHQIELEMQNEELRTAQVQIDAERARYFDFYNLATVGYCTLSKQGLILEANLTAATLLGTTRSKLVTQPLFRFIRSDDQDTYYLYRKKLFETGQAQECDLRLVKPDGGYIWANLKGTVDQADDGALLCCVVLSDITDRKRAEEAHRHSNALMQYIIEHTNSAVAVHDRDLRYLYVSDRYLRDFRVQEQNIIGKHHYDVFPDLPEKLREVHRKALAGVVSSSDRDPYERADGTVDWIRWECRPWYGANGSIDGIIVYTEVITERVQAEMALRKSEERFSLAMEASKDGIWDWDVTTGDIYCSPSLTSMLGYDSSDVIEHVDDWQDLIHPEDRQKAYQANLDCVNNLTESFEIEYRMKTRDGGWKWILGRGQAVYRDTSGRAVRMIGTHRDITGHKQAETYREMGHEILRILNEPGDLLEAIQRIIVVLKKMTGAAAVGVRLHDGEDFPYFTQDGFSQDFLLAENTLLKRDKDGDVCRDQDGNICLECTCGLVISGRTDPSVPLFTPGGSCWTNDTFPLLDLPPDQDPRLDPRNNCIHEGYASVALIPIRTREGIVGLIQLNDKRKGLFTLETIEILEGIATHIGSALMRKQAAEELRESEERFKALHNASFGGIAIHDQGVILECNQGLSATTGFGYDELIGMDGLLLIAEQSRKTVMHNIRTGYEQPYEVFGIRKNGQEYPVRLEARNIPYKGKMVRTVEFRDITEQKRAEEDRKKLQNQLIQAQKMETVGRLAGGVAHDFNNMLSVILGYSEMTLEQVPATHPMYKALHGIQQAAQRSADLTRQLLAFARKQTIAPRIIDLNETVEGMLKMLRRLIGEDIDLIWLPGRNLSPVKMDPTQIDQILANLCVNARDAIEGLGKVTIETGMALFDEAACCAVHTGAAPGEYALLAVSDSGCGMDRETISHMFEPFFTTKEQGKGTGLGLASVYGAVKQNKGFINVYSEPGQGTTFKIYLPRYQTRTDTLTRQDPNEAAARGHEIILLVEDEPTILKMTTMMLELQGYTVVAAATPNEAIRLAREHSGSIDLLVTDVIMPGMNGRELAQSILSVYPDMKCLFMSGYTANVIAHHGVLDQGVHFIQKPFTMKDLGAKLREALDRD